MAEATSAPAAAPAVEEERDPSIGKAAIYDEVVAFVKEKTGKNIGKAGGRKIFDLITAGVFATATSEKTFRFNAGYGSLHVREYKEGSRKLPSGKTTTFGVRHKVRYEEGVSVAALVKAATNGSPSTSGSGTVSLT